MMVELPHTERIHELTRHLEKNPGDVGAGEELRVLACERGKYIQGLVEKELEELDDLETDQDELARKDVPLSLSRQYKEACGLYRRIQRLVKENRELKKRLRKELYKKEEEDDG